jgi:hypothetical protein
MGTPKVGPLSSRLKRAVDIVAHPDICMLIFVLKSSINILYCKLVGMGMSDEEISDTIGGNPFAGHLEVER